jgi:Flp pilus assembly protein TadG
MRSDRQRKRVERGDALTRPARFRGDRGAVIAEAAFIAPFFFTLIFGMLEFGGAFRDYLTTSNGTVAGARVAAIQGNNPAADWYILNQIKTATGAMPFSQINYVIIYKAKNTDTGPPSGCLSSSNGTGGTGKTATPPYVGACNKYSQSDLTAAALGVGNTPPASPASNDWLDGVVADQTKWPASDRDVLVTSATNPDGPDYIGVYISTTHPWITGLFGNSITLTSNTVIQLEPQKLSS